MTTIRIADTTLHYDRTGRGSAMLFVHGTFGDGDNWADQAARLSDRHTCVRYDRRSYSRSHRGRSPVTTSRHADDAAGLIQALDLAPCLVVGSSAGAAVTVDLAMRHGSLLRGVVLCEPPLFSLDPAAGEAAIAELTPRVQKATAAGGPRAAVDAFASFAFPQGWAMLDEERRDALRDNAEAGFAEIESPPLEVSPDDLAAVTVPALVLTGNQSHPVMRSVSRRLAAALPDARLVELDSGHVPYLEIPDAFAHTVSVFATELDRRAVRSTPTDQR